MLKIVNLNKQYDKKLILKDVSFEINRGEIVTVLGENGAGKTTIIDCILKLVKPNSGNIFYDGININKIKNKNYFKNIGVLLESSSNVYDFLSGIQNIEYFCGLSNINLKNREKLDLYIHEFNMKDHMNKKVGAYSRGMQQKLALIIALMMEPKILLLDEPTLGLDIRSKILMIDVLKNIVSDQKIGILLTTHQMDVVQKIGGKVLLLKNGKVEAFDTISSLAKNSDKYKIVYYDKNNNLIELEEELNFNEIYRKYADYSIQEIKKVSVDIERVVMEKLDESV
ncbi:MAG: ABC transporter [Candidatus Cloacimonadota bacterium]|nr:MAG: ABC transporter [Candidatus Cloacimonadota bacterium]PIE79039.1 MAG: ABC transporter [Candidatus Delongbacteria bacterium]